MEREIWDEIPRSDLALERRRANTELAGVRLERMRSAIGHWERLSITDEEAAESVGRPIGHYDTLSVGRMDKLDRDRTEDASDEVARQLCLMCEGLRVYPERILTVGLGNRSLTPDSTGPKTVSRVEATLHLCQYERELFDGLECSQIATLEPGVTANTGIDSRETVLGVCNRIKPDLVIAVDSITATSPERLGSTIQFSDTGIRPGSGMGRCRGAIDRDYLGIPVLAVGVPTVIDLRHLCQRRDVRDMFVSPKDIDKIVDTASRIIAGGINQAFGVFC